MLKHSVLCIAVLLLIVVVAAQENQPAPKPAPTTSSSVPADAVRMVNPVKPTPESLALAKKYYVLDCAMCHGDNGDGKGPVAVDEKFDLKDLRDPATLKDKTDGELFYLLKNGKDHMPLERIRSSPNELWSLINYVRSLARKSAAVTDKAPPSL